MRKFLLRAWVLCWLILVWVLLWGNVSAANVLSGLAVALVITLLLPLPGWLQIVLWAYMLLYGIAALHAVYAASWLKTALKGIAVGFAYLVSLGIAMTAIAIGSIIV